MMTVERYLRLIAGLFIVASLALGHFVNPYWYLFTAFVGLTHISHHLAAEARDRPAIPSLRLLAVLNVL